MHSYAYRKHFYILKKITILNFNDKHERVGTHHAYALVYMQIQTKKKLFAWFILRKIPLPLSSIFVHRHTNTQFLYMLQWIG